MARPFADISKVAQPLERAARLLGAMEMVYRALYHYVRALHRGETLDVVAFLIADHKLFGLIKRKKPVKQIDRSQPLTDDEDA